MTRASDTPATSRLARVRVLATTGLRMMLHDKLRFAGTVFGVVFSVLISVQQIGVLNGLLSRNTTFVDNAGADVWVVPPGTDLLEPGTLLNESALHRARVTPGVEEAAPLILAGASIQTPDGGSEAITLVGADLDLGMGVPWNVVAGDPAYLSDPDTMFFEDSKRDSFGGLNLGSVREVNDTRIRVAGFTWGLEPFGPAFSFAGLDLARQLTGVPESRLNFVLVRIEPGTDPDAVAASLALRIPEYDVVTRQEFHDTIVQTLLAEQLGISFATSTVFGLLIGFTVVALAMFSSVLERERELATLKAIGCTNFHLGVLVMATAVAYGLIGSFVGLGLVTRVADALRRPELVIIIPDSLMLITPVVMVALTLGASLLALTRVWRLEPGMVFR